jgi:hypothetical protein
LLATFFSSLPFGRQNIDERTSSSDGCECSWGRIREGHLTTWRCKLALLKSHREVCSTERASEPSCRRERGRYGCSLRSICAFLRRRAPS